MKLTVVLQKVMRAVVTLLLAVTFVFFVLRLSGDPVRIMLSDDASQLEIDQMRQRLSVNGTLIEQYFAYTRAIFQGDFGRVVRLSDSLDHCGPMANSVVDCALLLEAMCGRDRMDATTLDLESPSPDVTRTDLRGMRIATLVDMDARYRDLSDASRAAFDGTLAHTRALGAEVVTLDLPRIELIHAASRAILFAEAYALHQHRLSAHPELFGQVTRERLTMGLFLDASDYITALEVRSKAVALYDHIFQGIDALLLPAGSSLPHMDRVEHPPFGAAVDIANAFNITGQPTLTLPAGMHDGLPLAVNLVGRRLGDGQLLEVGIALQNAANSRAAKPTC